MGHRDARLASAGRACPGSGGVDGRCTRHERGRLAPAGGLGARGALGRHGAGTGGSAARGPHARHRRVRSGRPGGGRPSLRCRSALRVGPCPVGRDVHRPGDAERGTAEEGSSCVRHPGRGGRACRRGSAVRSSPAPARLAVRRHGPGRPRGVHRGVRCPVRSDRPTRTASDEVVGVGSGGRGGPGGDGVRSACAGGVAQSPGSGRDRGDRAPSRFDRPRHEPARRQRHRSIARANDHRRGPDRHRRRGLSRGGARPGTRSPP